MILLPQNSLYTPWQVRQAQYIQNYLVGKAAVSTYHEFVTADSWFHLVVKGVEVARYKASSGDVQLLHSLNLDELTASKPLWLDSNKDVVSQDINLVDIVETRNPCYSLNIVTGTLSAGGLSACQTWGDGSVMNISEVAGTPGFDVQFTIANVTDFSRIEASAYYTGAITSHYAQFQIYDYTNTTWRDLWAFSGDNALNLRFSGLPVTKATRLADYISSGNVLVRFYHPTAGNAAHDLYVDYVGLVS